MKHLILLAILATTINACFPPFKPFPPFGCTNDDAVLVTTEDDECYWVWVGCD